MDSPTEYWFASVHESIEGLIVHKPWTHFHMDFPVREFVVVDQVSHFLVIAVPWKASGGILPCFLADFVQILARGCFLA